MARYVNGIGAVSGIVPGLSPDDMDYIMGLDPRGAPVLPVESRPLPRLTPSAPPLRGTIQPQGAPELRGSISPRASISGPRNPDVTGAIPRGQSTALPVGRGFAQAVYDRAIGAGLTDTQARLVASQAALESNHGRSGLSRSANNYFGIKAGRGYTGETASYRTREENAGGGSYYESARFRKYANPEDSFKDHLALLERRFPEALRAGNISEAAAGLRYGQQGGYATDKNYGAKLESIARGIRSPSDPMGGTPPQTDMARPVNQPNLPPEVAMQMQQPQDLVDRHQLTRPPEEYMQTGPHIMPVQQTPVDTQQFFQPLQMQQPQGGGFNALGGGGNDLASFFGMDGGGGGGGGFDLGFDLGFG